MAIHAWLPPGVRAAVGGGHTLRFEEEFAVPAQGAAPPREQQVRRRLQRDQRDWRRRHQYSECAYPGSNSNRAVLGRELTAVVESPRSRHLGRERFRPVGERATLRAAEPGDG